MTSDPIDEAIERYGPSYRWLITFTALTASVAMVLSATIVNVAIPSVMGAYGVGQDQAQWLATAFIATMVASQLLSAWIVNALGQKLAYFAINAVFLFGTAITLMAPNLDILILGRVLQGFSAGAIQPMSMALVFRIFPPQRRGTAMGIYGMGIQIAPMLGPMFGGIVIDALSWREIFLVPVPMCLLAMTLSLVLLPGSMSARGLPKFDWFSYGLLCASLLLLLSAGANGQRYGWHSDAIILSALAGLVAGAGFVRRQLRSASPLLDFTLFRNAQFSSAVCVAFVFGIGNFASNYLIPVFVQKVQGFTASLAGFMLVPAGVLVIAGTPLFGRAVDVLPAHLMVMVGLLLFALGNFLMSGSDVGTAFWTMAFLVVVARFGMALIMPSINSAALRALTREELNKGSGTLNFCRQLGGAFGITSLVVFMEQRTQFHAEALTATQSPANPASRELLQQVAGLMNEAGVPEAQHQAGAMHYLGEVIHAQASTFGFQDGFLMISIVFVLALIPAWILGRARPRTRTHLTAQAPAPSRD